MKNKKGFTLVELLAVIVLMSLVMMLIFPSIRKCHFEVDEDVYKYQHYEYKVVAIRKNENGDTMETIESDPIFIEVK